MARRQTAVDRSVRFLTALSGASTSRVLNLHHIAQSNKNNPEHARRPLFYSAVINASFLIKHRLRADELYQFPSARPIATKLIVPFDLRDLRAGGRSFFIDQPGYLDCLREIGNYGGAPSERDVTVLQLLNNVPSLDPFLVREHLRSHDIQIADCYFEISPSDQKQMTEFVAFEIRKLIELASGHRSGGDPSIARMVAALLSSEVSDKLEPLRKTLDLTPAEFSEGVFSWRGFLFYKWSMRKFWPQMLVVLREIGDSRALGPSDPETRTYLAAAKRNVIALVHDNGQHVRDVLGIYDKAYGELIENGSAKPFREFLLSAPHLFLQLGDKMGAISHIVTFWRYRFAVGAPLKVDAEELTAIFQDFASGFPPTPSDGAANLGNRPDLIRGEAQNA